MRDTHQKLLWDYQGLSLEQLRRYEQAIKETVGESMELRDLLMVRSAQ